MNEYVVWIREGGGAAVCKKINNTYLKENLENAETNRKHVTCTPIVDITENTAIHLFLKDIFRQCLWPKIAIIFKCKCASCFIFTPYYVVWAFSKSLDIFPKDHFEWLHSVSMITG